MKSISYKSEKLSYYSWDFKSEADVRFLFNISSVYPILNLVDVFIDFTDAPLSFRKFPLDIALKTRSTTIKKLESGQKIYVTTFSPSSIGWFEESEIKIEIEKFWEAAQHLIKTLESSYSNRNSLTRQTFARFGKN